MRRLFLVSLLLISGLFFTFSLASLSRQSAEAGSNPAHLVNPSFSLSPQIFPSLRIKQAPTSGQALSRRAPSINGRLEGSIQQLTPENVTLNGGATITEKLYVPGTPTVRRNGNPNFGGVIEGSGSAIPTNYQVTLNGNATLGNLVNRTNPVALTPVAVPPTPTGTRDVSLNNPNDQIGDFATLRNLTLNGNAGTRSVPPGTYGNFTVNGSSVLIFGIANATESAVYSLQGLTLNGGTQLQIVGPVTLTLRNGTNINGTIGNAANPQWLTLNVSNGGVTLNGGSQMFGKVNAPAGSVTVNSRLTGNVICDRLTVNGGGVVTILAQAPQDTTAPVITIAEPAQGLITKTSPVTVSGTVTDASAVTVTVNGQPVTLSGAQFSTTVTLAEGSNTITVLATDAFGNVGTASRSVTLDTTAPVLTVTSPQDGAVMTETQLTITGTVTDATATTVTVNNVAATRNGNEFSAVVSLVEGSNTFVIRAEDAAGNQTEATRTVTLQVPHDTTPPVITLTEPAEGLITNVSPITVSGTVTDASAVTVTVNNQPATRSGTEFTASVTLTEGSNTITVLATDAFGNASTVSRIVILDTIAPVLTVTSPIDGAFTTEAQITVSGTVTDATTISVTVNDIAATLTGNEFSAVVPLVEGPNPLVVRATDTAGNQTEQTRTVNRQLPRPLSLTLFAPADGEYSAIPTVTVYGYATGVGVTVTVNGTSVPVDVDGIFLADIPAVEGTNQFRVIATDAGGATQEVVRSVIVDSQPPVIGNLSPAPETVIPTPTTTISGTVTDTSPVRISINGLSVTATSGTFTVPDVPVREGVDYLRIVATDGANNTSGAELILVGKDRTPPASPTLFPITSPTRLTYQTIHGKAEPGAVISIGGGKSPVTTQAMLGTGIFVATVELNPGANTLTLVASDADGNVSSPTELTAISNPNLALPTTGEVSQVTLATGNSQFGLVNTELPRPLVVFVSDKDGNPVANVPVTFTVEYGGGTFINNATTMVIPTDVQGHAAARYVVGEETGVQIIQAEAPGNTFTPVLFFAEGREAFNQETSVSGVVMDQNLRALPNVLIRLGGQQTRTGGDGRFFLTQVAAGPHQLLEVIGRDEVTLPGRWPNISYDIDVLPGVNNYQRRPLFLPKVNDGILLPLNAANIVTQDTTYELPVLAGEPPIRVTAKAGTQVLFPPDITDKRLSVTRILPSHIPMALEDGRSTRLYISVQPSGTLFDPPLEVSFPNLDREPANAPVLLMSFDHDAGRYVQVGTGHVSADGRSVIGDPGSGIRVGAWHAFPPPPPKPTKCLTGESGRCTEEVWSEENPGVPIGECPSGLGSSRFGTKAAAPSDSLTCYEVCGKTPDEMGWIQGTAQASCPKPRVKTLSFVKGPADDFPGGADNLGKMGEPIKILRDGLLEDYSEPHWEDTNQNGQDIDPGDRVFPVCYKRNKFICVKVKFVFEKKCAKKETMTIKGEQGMITFTKSVEINKDQESVEVSIWSQQPLPDSVTIFENFDIEWSFINSKNNPIPAGTTRNRLYVIFDQSQPPASKPAESLLDIGCRVTTTKGTNESEETFKQKVIDNIWSTFESRRVSRKKKDGFNHPDGVVLKYWLPENELTSEEEVSNQCANAFQMLQQKDSNKNGVGSCAGWADLFHRVLRAQGIIESEIYEITAAGSGEDGFLVKDWKFGEHIWAGPDKKCETTKAPNDVEVTVVFKPEHFHVSCISPGKDTVLDSKIAAGIDDRISNIGVFISINSRFPFVLGEAPLPGRYMLPYGDIFKLQRIPAQGNTTSPGGFGNHFVVKMHNNNRVYDPSYGEDYPDELSHEKASFVGITSGISVRKKTDQKELIYTRKTGLEE